MSSPKGLVKELDEKYVEMVAKFVSNIRYGKLEGSQNIALATVSFLEQIIIESQNTSAFELCGVVRAVGRRVARALPHELVAANMVRRVLKAIRDEHRAQANQSDEVCGESLQRLVLAAPARRATLPSGGDLREPIRDHIAELRAELESCSSSISSQAREHIHGEELVLVQGGGALVERFLRAAAHTKYRLVVAEGTDVKESHSMAHRLSTCGVRVTVTQAAAVFALMARVNKVVVGVEATLCGGTVLAARGSLAVTAAAQHYNVPVIALSPLHKLCPQHACEHQQTAERAPPHALPYECTTEGVHVVAPRHDYIPPDHIALFVTNLGGSSPSYVYRLLSELYDPNDYQL